MKLVYSEFSTALASGSGLHIISIESPQMFTHTTDEIIDQISGQEGPFSFSEIEDSSKLSQICDFISCPLQLSVNDRKITTKLVKSLAIEAQEHDIHQQIYKLIDELKLTLSEIVISAEYAELSDSEIQLSDLLQLFGVHFSLDSSSTLLERIENYCRIRTSYDGKQLFIINQLYAYLDETEMNELDHFCKREHIMILSLERSLSESRSFKCYHVLIIDGDLCEINQNEP